MTINISIPSNDALVAGEIGLALVRIARANGFNGGELTTTLSIQLPDIEPEPRTAIEHVAVTETRITDTVQDPIDAMEEQAHTTPTGLDKDGLPWDARIHSSGRDVKADGTWRLRRKPKDMDEAEWDAFVTKTTSDLRALMSIPAKMTQTPALVEVDEPVAPVLTPPVIVPPPIVPPVTSTVEVTTFAQLMTWLTSRTPKDDTQRSVMLGKVNGVVELHGLKSLQDLQQRPDLIPQVLTDLRVQLGE